MSPLASSRILILACSATKRAGAERMSAIERYDGPLLIEPYDARMTREIAARKEAGGVGMRWPRPATQLRVMLSGEHPGMHIAMMSGHGRRPLRDVGLFGGHLTLDLMRHFVGLSRDGGHLTPDAGVTGINGSIGVMRRQIRLWLERSDDADGEGR